MATDLSSTSSDPKETAGKSSYLRNIFGLRKSSEPSSASTESPPTQSTNETAEAEANSEMDAWITSRLAGWRSEAWEDDISRNTLDSKPFENLPPISERLDEIIGPHRWIPQAICNSVDIKQMAARDTLPIPCPADREGYSPGYDANYWMSGLGDFFKIMEEAAKHDIPVRSFFDFGCASGRVIRHFALQSDVEQVWGSDINNRHIRWLCDYMPSNVRAIANHCIPSLPIPDNSIDVVSAFSVFTHIDTFETCWLAELSRVLRPGGMAYLTVHNEATWEKLRNEVDNEQNRLVQSIQKVDPNVREKLQQPLPDCKTVYRFTNFGPYRAQVFHSNNYLHRVWGRFFNILDIKDCFHVRQTVVVLQKPAA